MQRLDTTHLKTKVNGEGIVQTTNRKCSESYSGTKIPWPAMAVRVRFPSRARYYEPASVFQKSVLFACIISPTDCRLGISRNGGGILLAYSPKLLILIIFGECQAKTPPVVEYGSARRPEGWGESVDTLLRDVLEKKVNNRYL